MLLDVLASDGAALIGAFALFVPILGAPIISMVTGVFVGLRLDADEQSAAVVSGAGTFFGFVLMLFILLFFGAIASGGGGDGGDGSIGELLVPLVAFGTGVALTAAGSTFIVK